MSIAALTHPTLVLSLFHLCETVVQRVAGAADGADRVLLAAGVEQLAQAADMHIDGALVDIDVAAPDAVEQLLDSVWGRDIYIDERTVDVHIGRLRKLLNPGREQDPIRTVRGAGYALDDRFAKVE